MMITPDSDVAIICESMNAGKQAIRFSAQLPANLNLKLWNFRELSKRETRNTAASTAASAVVVIFSMSGSKPLPAQVENWIEMWIWLLDRRKPALIALFAAQDPESARVQTYLRRGALSKGLAFPHTRTASAQIPMTTRRFQPRGKMKSIGWRRPRSDFYMLPPRSVRMHKPI